MSKEGVSFQGLDHCDHTIMAADPQIIALGNIMSQDYSRALANSREHR
jgi:hypothetical protein